MKLINFVNDAYKIKTAQQILTEGNTDGKEGLSWKEVNVLIEKGHNKDYFWMKVAKMLKNVDSMTDSVFKAMDIDNDEIITEAECDIFAREKCDVSFKTINAISAPITIKTSTKNKNKILFLSFFNFLNIKSHPFY